MIKRYLMFLILILCFGATMPTFAGSKVGKSCTYKGKQLYGKVQVVKHFPDLKIQKVQNFPDLKVKWVQHFPDKCGVWQKVDHFPDLKIQFVEHFPDLKVQFVDHFPGIP